MKNLFKKPLLFLTRFGFYIPFTFYFLLFGTGTFLAWLWLSKKASDEESSYAAIFELLLNIAAYSCVFILSFALLTTLISYIFILIKNKKQQLIFKVDAKAKTNSSNNKQPISIYISPVLKPLLGFVKIRMKHDGMYGQKFLLAEAHQNKLFSTIINGIYNWPLQQIKEYHIESAIIYFEDFFQFFSFAIKLNTGNRFITEPKENTNKESKAIPRKTEETNTRIEEIRRIEGEYLNYKNFENNDDVRRIVWKIYAKNKELVVRIPEIMDPYASHIYMYASFYSAFTVSGNSIANIPFLNYYKNTVWSVYKQLLKQGFEVRYIPDVPSPQKTFNNTDDTVKYNISTSSWQQHNDIKAYCKTKDAAVLVISSFSDADEVTQLAEQHENDIVFIFAKLSESLSSKAFASWIKWIFVSSNSEDIAVHRRNWSLSAMRNAVLKNEEKLEQIIKQLNRSTIV